MLKNIPWRSSHNDNKSHRSLFSRVTITTILPLFLVTLVTAASFDETPTGWASTGNGTTGGTGGTHDTVTTLTELNAALKQSSKAVIWVKGTLTGRVDIPTSDKTILGLPGAKIVGGMDITGSSSKRLSNIIVRNLEFQGPGSNDVDGVDCIAIQYATNVWIDHMDVYDGQDGNMDMTNEADLITVSWVKWHYEKDGNHRFSNLIGSSDSKTTDREKLRITMQYNWWADGVVERMPRVRFGKVHVVNNLFTSKDADYCVRAGVEANILIQNNAFSGIKNPIDYNGKQSAVTAVTLKDNLYTNCSGNMSGYNTAFTPPYTLTIIPAQQVEAKVKAGAGATLTFGSSTIPKYSLNTSIAQGQGTVSPSEGDYDSGSSVLIKATPSAGYKFDHWSGSISGTSNEITITFDDNKSISAHFVVDSGNTRYYSVNVTSNEGGNVVQNPQGTSLSANSTVTFTATPELGYFFSGWSGDYTSTDETLTINSLSANISISAIFSNSIASGNAIYVSPEGRDDAPGTIEAPTTLPVAIRTIAAGDTIYMRNGTYAFDTTVRIERTNIGTNGNRKVITAYRNEKPVLDFASQSYTSNTATNGRGIQLDGNYWHLYGLDVCNAADNGIFISGNNNIVERCITRKNRDSGLQISRYASTATKEEWPSHNLILNCESLDNYDKPPCSGENADGFACKLTSGPGNVFRGCYAHNNIDDGWDLYTKDETGAIDPVIIDKCIASHNGILTDGTSNSSGDRNGFKLGGEDIPVAHTVTRCVAFCNGKNGFTWNSNPGAILLANCFAFDNGEGNFKFGDNSTMTEAIFTNNVSFWTDLNADVTDKYRGTDVSNSNCWWDKSKTQPSINGKGLIVSTEDFELSFDNITIIRSFDESLNFSPFKLASGSDLINAGVVPDGVLPFSIANYYIDIPDLGALELGSDLVSVKNVSKSRIGMQLANDRMSLHIVAPSSGVLNVMLLNLSGTVISTLTRAHVIKGNNSIPAQIPGIASGSYIISAKLGNKTIGNYRLIKP